MNLSEGQPPDDRDERGAVFQRPAELVDISERIFQQVFAVGLWVATGLSAFASLSSLLQPTASSQLRGFAVCAGYATVCAAAAWRPAGVYFALRRQPWWLLVAAFSLGLGGWFVGEDNFPLYLPIIAVLGVAGIATPRHVLIVASGIAGAGLAAPHLIGGDGNLGGPIAVLIPPLLFWLIVDRIASFALRLHQSLGPTDERGADRWSSPPDPDTVRREARPRDDRERLGLPAPRVIEVDGVRFTARQLQALLLCAEGLTNREIGICLEIGATQVGRHLNQARKRAGATTNAELVAWGIAGGLVPRTNVPR